MLIIKHTVETTTSPEEIWDIWQDVSNWNTWDHGIEFSTINGPLREGTTGTLKPKGGPLVHTTLTAVESMKMFIDESKLPLTRIIVSHFMNRLNGKTQVTHHVFVDTVVNCPLLPRSKVHFHLLVDETVCQRSWHSISNTLVAFAVTCGNHHNIVG